MINLIAKTIFHKVTDSPSDACGLHVCAAVGIPLLGIHVTHRKENQLYFTLTMRTNEFLSLTMWTVEPLQLNTVILLILILLLGTCMLLMQSLSEAILTKFGEKYTIFWPYFKEKAYYFRTFHLYKSYFLHLSLYPFY